MITAAPGSSIQFNKLVRSLLAIFAAMTSEMLVTACELCAVYNAASANNEFSPGFTFSLSEQYIHFGTEQLDEREVKRDDPNYLHSSITHLVPGYNFSSRFGINLNLPLVYRRFERSDLFFSPTAPPTLVTERGSEFDLGDLALIGRWTAFKKRAMEFDVVVNVLGGIKFPTGDTDRLEDEVEQAKVYDSLIPPNTPHDPLDHSISSVHQHDLSAGSGSFDGLFGLTVNTRWRRWLFNAQFQYSLRTAGQSDFRYGDDLLVSFGPGRYLVAKDKLSLSIQALAVYETMARDEILGEKSSRTGSTAWYLGPQFNFAWGEHLSANAGVDVPLHITVNGFQVVPDYRVHGGLSWRF